MMSASDSENIVKTSPAANSQAEAKSDVNENNAAKSACLLMPTGNAMGDVTVPLVPSPAAMATSLPFSPVASQPQIMGFASGINLTISNGVINVKSGGAGEGAVLMAPTTLTTPSLSNCPSTLTSPITVAKGSVPVMSSPACSMAVTSQHTPLKVPTPHSIQLRPQLYSPLPSTSLVAMHSRLSLPFQSPAPPLRPLAPGTLPTSPALSQSLQFQTMTPLRSTSVTTSPVLSQPLQFQTLTPLRPNTPVTAATPALSQPLQFQAMTPLHSTTPVTTSPVLSQPLQFQTMTPLRTTPVTTSGVLTQPLQFQTMTPLRPAPVTIAAASQPHQQQPLVAAAPQMSIRPAGFPLLLNRAVAFAGRQQLLAAQPARLGPRQIGGQVALQVAAQQPVSAATIMPLFRPAQPNKTINVNTAGVVTNPAISTGAQVSQPQFVNQMMPGMTHISFRPNLPTANMRLERPQKIPDARFLTSVPVNRLLRPHSLTTITAPVGGSEALAGSMSMPGVVPQCITVDTSQAPTLLPKPDMNAQTPEKKETSLVGEPAVHVSSPQLVSKVSDAASPMSAISKSPARNETPVKSESDAKEEKGEEATVTAPSSTSADFDPLKAMEWSGGIASLPGSNLKFKLNEFGLMEMVCEDATAAPPLKTVVDSAVGVNTTDFTITASFNKPKEGETVTREKEPLKKCENCGKYGFLRDFCKKGRFCSLSCVGTYAGKKNKQPTAQSLLSNKMVLNLKKKHQKLLSQENSAPTNSTPDADTSAADNDKTPLQVRKPKGFDWQTYLDEQKAVGAPPKLFKDPFPTQKNGFKVGMRLEGVDPKHQNLFCVLTVVDVVGYRLRLHFDGYSECFDFWCNADSPFIFPVGWCEKNNKVLQPPKKDRDLHYETFFTESGFSWSAYLRIQKAVAAPKTLFQNQPATQMVTPSAFRVGMKLEAVDRKNTALICVATVADILGDKVLVHFDGWEQLYDYWCDQTSPYIHPVGWCQENARTLSPPFDCPDVENFTWDDYLAQTKSQPVPARAFKPRPPVGFEAGMKVEAVDRRNPILIRVATLQEVKEHQVLLHFDGWPEMYDYWVDDDSTDIKPPGWCNRMGNSLQPPYVQETHVQGSCPTPGCNGVGHIKGGKYSGHHSTFGCPYSSLNMNKENTLQDRLGSTRVEEGTAMPFAVRVKTEGGEIRKCPTPGCDSSGHITGKFTSHHRLSGCPLYEKNIQRLQAEQAAKAVVRPGRGRKRKHFHFGETDSREESSPKPKKERLDSTAAFYEGVHQSVFMSAVPPTPSQEGPAHWDYQSRLLPGVHSLQGEEVKGWGVEEVAAFVASLPGCHEHGTKFREQEIDGDSFLMLTQADIVKILKVRLGPALKIYNSVLQFQQSTDSWAQ